ncbi:PD-(D/E)XK nuclease family protein [Cupriavidus sp. L7L]|uniref:PDDEXK-like family protein n=1 Tax=Cupriavidus sp. L7L TaxID=2546443 RepID=UPI00105588F3|nr:PD-(D/E)XK nuclease family protein [Cupriavidus sp. L7L]TDF62051.1 hypothetical protein E1J61_31625 [Cupriavidus sp. L7L]
MATQEQFEHFLTDPTLSRAIEASRRVDDVFELIRPNENQHSSILQWLFDPREGHGQGEAIFKDFLTAAHEANRDAGGEQELLAYWTPGRIAVAGFQSLIVVRERAMVSNAGRQDLFLVDPVHKFVLLVENKAGRKWSTEQLKSYRDGATRLTAKVRGPFPGYKTGFVLLDRYKDVEDTPSTPAASREIRRWAYLDYGWLEKAARRAEARVEKGIEAGQQLVIAYCRRQAEYKSKDEEELEALLSALVRDHRDVVADIGVARARRHPVAKDLRMDGHASQLWIWTHQHKDLALKLRGQKTFSFLKHDLKTAIANLRPDVRPHKREAFVIDESWEKLMRTEPDERGRILWPICILITQMQADEDDDVEFGAAARRYKICVQFRPHHLRESGIETPIRSALAIKYPKDMTRRQDARRRRFGHVENIGEDQLVEKVATLYRTLHALLTPTLGKG